MKAILALFIFATPAAAQDYTAFQSPTGNIHCAIFTGDYAGARCDVLQLNPSYTKRPADCDLDYGSAFYIGPRDRMGEVGCVGDTVADPQSAVLGYGGSISLGGITCTSAQSGMTCVNAAGHGFRVARSRQSVF
jgi:hypothetical protein